ncbi:plasmid replication initiation protein [Staphylococcus epidermidis]|uniref:replication initiation protein n=1 Tax=Staphylococcus epidermidis TaxID=1282 RepID=UPI001933D47C|nr:RepB family plasmid replication initiator protein [Staphylococcus epidermidis]MBM0752780.1 RepB family plasmid replication initiator protein [Staphylococcus epidermidis]MBM0765197.1 RepB family plasmid replication initiator protein [Staphylococcus epidermidis]MBM0789397.1 RepB family plasmid replication initiator protein [Staphylococcus epidermidis]
MSGETVVYQNEMNLVPLRKFTSTEIDIFFSLCNKLKEQDIKEVSISFEELRHLSNYYHRSQKRFVKDLEHVYDKLLSLTYTERSGLSFKKFVLFTGYEVNVDTQELIVSINPKLKHVLNEITKDFTKFELKEMTHINQKVLTPIINELNFIFKNLHINKIKAKKGRKIEWIEFTFDPEKRIHSKRQLQKQDHVISNRYMSLEKTLKWLDEKIYTQSQEMHNEDLKLKQDREAFQRQLEEKWKE